MATVRALGGDHVSGAARRRDAPALAAPRQHALPLLLGLAHGVADGAAGLVVFPLPQSLSPGEVGALVVLYNALAFGGQMLLAPLVDRRQQPRAALLGGLSLLAAALLASGWQPALAVGLAGVGSAAFHVGGGALAVSATPGCASGPGWFTAPGVLGFGIAGVLVVAQIPAVGPALLLLLLVGSALTAAELPPLPAVRAAQSSGLTTARRD